MRRDKKTQYRDYSDDSWFTTLINGLGGTGGCCWYPMLAMTGLLALIIWLSSLLV